MTRSPGTYALLLEVAAPAEVEVGRLGARHFGAGVYLYAGSAFGSGGLAARLGHHLRAAPRLHWHIDFLRSVARVAAVWSTTDRRRLECTWASAARALRGAHAVPGFGASDCRCGSHLVGLSRAPSRRAFRRAIDGLDPPCAPIRRFAPSEARSDWRFTPDPGSLSL